MVPIDLTKWAYFYNSNFFAIGDSQLRSLFMEGDNVYESLNLFEANVVILFAWN